MRAASYLTVVQIPEQLYRAFLRQNGLVERTRQILDNRRFLQETFLFGELVGFPVERAVAAAMQPIRVPAGREIPSGDGSRLVLVGSGEVELLFDGQRCELLGRGAYCGEDALLYGKGPFAARAVSDAELYAIPARIISDIPIVQWNLLQTAERRLQHPALGKVRPTRASGP